MINDPDFSGVTDIDGAEPEVADPAETENTAADQEEESSPVEGDTAQETADPATFNEYDEGEKEPQSPEENAKYAEIRRKYKAQRDAAVEKAKAEAAVSAQKLIDEKIAELNMLDPYTNRPITNKQEFDAYQERRYREERERVNAVLRDSGMDENALLTIINNHPDVVAARKIKSETEALKTQLQSQKNMQQIETDIAEISKMDPSIKRPEDVLISPNSARILELMRKGYRMPDAYLVANREKITAGTAAKAEQAARNNAASKTHLGKNISVGGGAGEIPGDEMAEFRRLMPGKSPAEIRAWYQKDKAKRAK